METTSIILLAVSASISFALGRTIMHFRNKKKKSDAQKITAKALRDAPSEVASKNKSKRRRQMQQIEKSEKSRV